MQQNKKISLDEFVEFFYQSLPRFRTLDCFLRGLNFHSFFINNLPPRDLKISFCGSLDQLKRAIEGYDIELIGELNEVSESTFVYKIVNYELCIQIEHFRNLDSLEVFLTKRPFGFQHTLYSLRLGEEIDNSENQGSFNLSCYGEIEKESEDLMDLLRLCLCKQKVPSQILGSELMPQIPADSEALNLLLSEWIVDYRVGSVIDDLQYFNCLPSICDDLLSKSLSGIRWFEQNQKIIEQNFIQCFPEEQLSTCKAIFYVCISSQTDMDTLAFTDNKVFAGIINETQDWWLTRLQGESLNTGLIESWINKFRSQYQLAVFCSCLMTVNKFKNSAWLDLEVCFSRISGILSEMRQEEDHVASELMNHLNQEVAPDLIIAALIESWGGRLRTRKQWQNFLGLN